MPAAAEPIGLHGLKNGQPVLLSQARWWRHYDTVLCRLADFGTERGNPQAAQRIVLSRGVVVPDGCAERRGLAGVKVRHAGRAGEDVMARRTSGAGEGV